MALAKVNTATLIRGQVYVFRHPDSKPEKPLDSLRFEAGVPVIIKEPHILAKLEEMSDEVGDGDGEFYDKPVFRINRGVDSPDAPRPRAAKLAADRVVKKRRPRRT